MKRILLFGVGRSTHTLVKYLVNYCAEQNYHLVLVDKSVNSFIQSYLNIKNCSFIPLEINNIHLRQEQISSSDLVISMLPPKFHLTIAKDCIFFRKNLITASYVSTEIAKLDKEAKKAGILILNEVGLDPGIDHISAMDIIDSIKEKDGVIHSFKSFCGGLIAPESDNNPWNYKFTWNPKNVVLAGSSGASYIKDNKVKKLSYQEVFSNLEQVHIPHYGDFESYANRDSLHYKEKYNLKDAHTIVRGTLRKKGFASAWDVFVQLGMTSEKNKTIISQKEFYNYLKKINNPTINIKMNYLDIFNVDYERMNYNSPAEYLLHVLMKKWVLGSNDKDMIVMQHKFHYSINDIKKDLTLSMVVRGDDNIHTGMAKTVGLPVFFASKLLLENKISLKGVKIPIYKEFYKPVLRDLKNEGIDFIRS